jgi:hypothetical protein
LNIQSVGTSALIWSTLIKPPIKTKSRFNSSKGRQVWPRCFSVCDWCSFHQNKKLPFLVEYALYLL